MLAPYTRKNHNLWNPFADWSDLDRAFFPTASIGEFKTDIRDTGDSYTLEADLPGCKKEDITIDLTDGTLTITAQRHREYEQKEQKDGYIRCERSYGSYSRSFDTTGIDTANIKASYKDGVLTLTMPKQQPQAASTRRLEIE
ncbi:MAG: Hsp20/alpha crystallin family protein [Oscillospiraceae bacterium]|nr:Hsp20/alpha crystallin family protein [Oscillospiraceae bacterium]